MRLCAHKLLLLPVTVGQVPVRQEGGSFLTLMKGLLERTEQGLLGGSFD